MNDGNILHADEEILQYIEDRISDIEARIADDHAVLENLYQVKFDLIKIMMRRKRYREGVAHGNN